MIYSFIPSAQQDEQFKLFHTIVTKTGKQKFLWISNYGNAFMTFDYKQGVKQVKTYQTSTNKGRKGYLAFSSNDWPCKYIHQAVAMLFHANPYNLKEVNHKDGNTHNNAWYNLEWCDRSANMKHRYGHTNYHNNYSLYAQLN